MSQYLFTPLNTGMTQIFQEIQKPIVLNQFNTGNSDILLILTESYLIMCDNAQTQIPTHFCKLSFNVKSETLFKSMSNAGQQPQLNIKKPLGIRLQRQDCTEQITFYCQHTHILDQWSIQLEKKINQRNFHKLFKAKKKIGKGAFATVYLAQRLRDNQMVAVKAFSKQKQYSGDKGRQSLQNEIKLMRHISHSNIMRLEGVYETDNSIYVILEYLEGLQLNSILKSGQLLNESQKQQIIKNLLLALSYLSENKIVHRDLKPQNIMFRNESKSTDVVICDFGLATFIHQQKYLFVRCGTPGYVSPEIINIKNMESKSETISDVFSAGLIFHYILFGCSIFNGKKYNEILQQNRACNFDFTLPRYQQISSQALDLLTKMLEKDPSKRITSKSALHHSYFSNGMDIEYPQKRVLFRQIPQNSQKFQEKTFQIQDTPSTITSKRTVIINKNNSQHNRSQNRRLFG